MNSKRIMLMFMFVVIGVICFVSCTSSHSESNELPNWSEDLEYEIKKAYAETYFGYSDDDTLNSEDVVMTYYGTYSGYEAVQNTGLGSLVITPIEVGGHLFQFGTSNVILLYKDGKFVEFHIAFREGKITQDDINKLYEVYSTVNSPKKE